MSKKRSLIKKLFNIREESNIEKLFRIIKYNDVEACNNILSQMNAEDLIIMDKLEQTPLICAIQNDREEIAISILRRMNVQDVTALKYKGQGMLYCAAHYGQSLLCVELLSFLTNEEVSEIDENGFTVLTGALESKCPEELCITIASRSNSVTVNSIVQYGHTALHLAVVNKYLKLSKLLVEMMPSEVINIVSNDVHISVIHMAIQCGCDDIAMILLPYMSQENLKLKWHNDISLLLFAMVKRYKEFCKSFIDNVDVDFFYNTHDINDTSTIFSRYLGYFTSKQCLEAAKSLFNKLNANLINECDREKFKEVALYKAFNIHNTAMCEFIIPQIPISTLKKCFAIVANNIPGIHRYSEIIDNIEQISTNPDAVRMLITLLDQMNNLNNDKLLPNIDMVGKVEDSEDNV